MQHDVKWLDAGIHPIDTRSMATPPDDQDELDHLDASLVIWAREIPDLDPLTEGIVERIQMLAHGFDDSAASNLAAFGLDRRAFKVLGRLRRVGPPYRRS